MSDDILQLWLTNSHTTATIKARAAEAGYAALKNKETKHARAMGVMASAHREAADVYGAYLEEASKP